jgi:hypothetical protein
MTGKVGAIQKIVDAFFMNNGKSASKYKIPREEQNKMSGAFKLKTKN